MQRRNILFNNSKEQKLAGVLYLPDMSGQLPTIIFCHGLGTSNKSSSATQFIKLIIEEGFAVLAFDFHGHGESEGEFSEVTITQGIDDLKSAIGFAIKQPEIDSSRIGVLGSSFGGAVAINTALRDDRIKVLGLKAPVINYEKSLESRKELTKSWKETGYRVCNTWRHGKEGEEKIKWSYALDAVKNNVIPHAKELKIPIIIVVGTEDRSVVPEAAKEFYDNLECDKKIFWLQGAGHNWGDKEKKEGLAKITEWFKKHL